MLKNAPPGTELIISGISILVSLLLVFGMMYSWFVLQSDRATMIFVGFIVFIMIMTTVYYLRRGDTGEDEEEEEDSENRVSLDPDEFDN